MRLTPSLLLLLFFFASDILVAQAQESPEWPYGGEIDSSRKNIFHEKAPLNFTTPADFSSANFASSAYFSSAKFASSAYFRSAKFASDADFSSANFASYAAFDFANFASDASFWSANFASYAAFGFANFASYAAFSSAKFASYAAFGFAKFASSADFIFANFDLDADFSCADFDLDADFRYANFASSADFSSAKFASSADFSSAKFASSADFRDAQFHKKVNFDNTVFSDTVYFWSTTFQEGVDFRYSNFDSVKTIFIDHNTSFPDGKLRLHWKQFKSSEAFWPWEEKNLRIALVDPPKDSLKHYNYISTFYTKLHDNYLAQGDKASADAVMYELAWQRAEILGEWYWLLYGDFFGWGYRPLVFLMKVVLPCWLIFAVFWFWRYYNLIAPIVDKDTLNLIQDSLVHEAISNPEKPPRFRHKNIAKHIAWPARIGHSLFFSASLLVSIRFKREWLEKEDKRFLTFVTFEWLLGIGLYVTFAAFVKTSEFAFVKGLLGF